MPPSLALCLCVAFILWLFVKDARLRNNISGALWIPLTWAFVIGSKPVSLWLGAGSDLVSADGYLQDKLLDKALFLFLIIAGLFVLWRRRANWPRIFRENKWLLAYFLYLGFSVLWSDDSFVSFKRW